MLKMSPILTSATQKSMNLVNEFGSGDCDENEARKAFTSIKKPIGADYLLANHVNHIVSNCLTSEAKTAFD